MMKPWNILFSLRDRLQLAGIAVVMAFSALLEAVGIGLLFPIVAAVADPAGFESNTWLRQTRHVQSEYFGTLSEGGFILAGCLLIALLYLFKNLIALWVARLQARFVYRKEAELSGQLFCAYLQAPYPFHLKHGVAESTTIMERIPVVCREFLMPLACMLADLLAVLVLGGVLAALMPGILGVAAAVLLIGGALIYFPLRKKNQACGAAEADYELTAGRALFNGLSGIKSVKAFCAEEHFLRAFTENRAGASGRRAVRYVLGQLPRLLLESVAILLALGIFAVLFLSGMSRGDILIRFGLLIAVLSRLLPAFSRIHYALTLLRQNRVNFRSVCEALQIPPEETGAGNTVPFERELRFDHVSFTYPDGREVLHDLSFVLKAKESLALVGPTGGGKTTVLDLALGLLRPVSGSITVDGRDIFSDLTGWRRTLAYVPQQVFLFDGTIEENIAIGVPGKPLDHDRVREVLAVAQLDRFVDSLPLGGATEIGENGVRLSGGQRQRLGIARALYSRPKLLILDEATSALDPETENALSEALAALRGEVTILMAAHRLSTVESCDARLEIHPAGRT